MTDEKKKTEKKAEDATKKPVEKPQPASKEKVGENISEGQKIEDAVETSEKVEKKPDVEKVDKPVLETPTEEKTVEDEGKPKKEETKEKKVETVETPESKEGKTELKETQSKEKPVETKPQKATEPKKPAKKQDEKDEDFQYIVRIANTDIGGDKTLIMGIAQIKGIGRHMAVLIADATGIDKKIKMGKLTDAQIGKIKKALEDIQNIAPGWMLNHRKDIDTGKDIHLISSDVELRLRDDVNLLKMIRSYRGIRHETGLSVRGQRTRANNRRGLALGVSKKRPGA